MTETVTLYDLTNTYMEGQSELNEAAQFGRMRRCDGRALHVRKTSKAEPGLMRIYQALGISASAGGIKKLVV